MVVYLFLGLFPNMYLELSISLTLPAMKLSALQYVISSTSTSEIFPSVDIIASKVAIVLDSKLPKNVSPQGISSSWKDKFKALYLKSSSSIVDSQRLYMFIPYWYTSFLSSIIFFNSPTGDLFSKFLIITLTPRYNDKFNIYAQCKI